MLEDVEFLYNDDEFVLLVITVDVVIFALELLLLFELLFFEDSVLFLVEGGG